MRVFVCVWGGGQLRVVWLYTRLHLLMVNACYNDVIAIGFVTNNRASCLTHPKVGWFMTDHFPNGACMLIKPILPVINCHVQAV